LALEFDIDVAVKKKFFGKDETHEKKQPKQPSSALFAFVIGCRWLSAQKLSFLDLKKIGSITVM
jgi:hypothetical protein